MKEVREVQSYLRCRESGVAAIDLILAPEKLLRLTGGQCVETKDLLQIFY